MDTTYDPIGAKKEWYKLGAKTAGETADALAITETWCNEKPGRKWRYFYRKVTNKSLPKLLEKLSRYWFVWCSEDELQILLQQLKTTVPTAKAICYQWTNLIRPFSNDEIKALEWLLDSAESLYASRGNKLPRLAHTGVIDLPGLPGLRGYVKLQQGQPDVDLFYLELLDDWYYLKVKKGIARKEKRNTTKENPIGVTTFKGERWFAFRMLYQKEYLVEERLLQWVEEMDDEELMLETFLPMDNLDLSPEEMEAVSKRCERGSIEWKKRTQRLLFTGYLFVKMNAKVLLRLIEGANEPVPGVRLFSYMMKERGIPTVIPTPSMESFRQAITEETLQLDMGADEIRENEYVVFRGSEERKHLKGRIGRIAYKKGKMYFTFMPFMGLIASCCKGFEVTKEEIRKPTKKEKKEFGIG